MSILEQTNKGRSKSLEHLRLSWEMVSIQLGGIQIDALRKSLQQLLLRGWFRRVWIIQEAGNARVASIVCGDKTIPSSIFSAMPLLMDLELEPQVQAVLDVMPGPFRKGSWWNCDRRFLTLISKFNNSAATRDHDRIYALLGIASDPPDLPIAYGCSFQQVIHQTISLLVLGDASLGHLLDYDDSLPDKIHGTESIFSISRVFQGITDINDLSSRVFEMACEKRLETFLKYMIDSSPIFGTIAKDSGYPSSLSIALSRYFDCQLRIGRDSLNLPMFSYAPVEDNYFFRAHVTEFEDTELFDPGYNQLLWPTPNTTFEEVIARLKVTAPERLGGILAAAVRLNRNGHVRMLLAYGAGGDNAQVTRLDMLCYALELGHIQTARALQNKATRTDARYQQRLTDFLWRLCQVGDKHNVLLTVIAGGADINAYELDRNPLHAAVHFRQTRVVQTLLLKGANLASRDRDEYTPLHLAEIAAHEDIIAALLLSGADELAVDREGRTPWQLNKRNRSGMKRRTKQDIEYGLLPHVNESARHRYVGLSEGRDEEEGWAREQHLWGEAASHNYIFTSHEVVKRSPEGHGEGMVYRDDDQSAGQPEEYDVLRRIAPKPGPSLPHYPGVESNKNSKRRRLFY